MQALTAKFRTGIAVVRDILMRLARERDGVEAIEFAIVLPVMCLFLLGCIEFGRLYWIQSQLQFAAEAAARCVTVTCQASNIVGTGVNTYAAKQMNNGDVPTGVIFSLTNPSPACGNQVTVCYPFTFIVPTLFPFSNSVAGCPAGYAPPTAGLTLTATGCHQA